MERAVRGFPDFGGFWIVCFCANLAIFCNLWIYLASDRWGKSVAAGVNL
jgi:hypothetical protein